MTYGAAKAFHLVAMVAWMAGLFYLPRLFVYHAEAQRGEEPARGILTAQYTVMEGRLLDIIMTPAAVATFVAGGTMLWWRPETLREPWFHVKAALLVGLVAYHAWCIASARRLARGEAVMSAERFRVMNEVPTVALALICTYAVLRGQVGLLSGVALSAVLVVLLGLGIQVYAVVRRRAPARAA